MKFLSVRGVLLAAGACLMLLAAAPGIIAYHASREWLVQFQQQVQARIETDLGFFTPMQATALHAALALALLGAGAGLCRMALNRDRWRSGP